MLTLYIRASLNLMIEQMNALKKLSEKIASEYSIDKTGEI